MCVGKTPVWHCSMVMYLLILRFFKVGCGNGIVVVVVSKRVSVRVIVWVRISSVVVVDVTEVVSVSLNVAVTDANSVTEEVSVSEVRVVSEKVWVTEVVSVSPNVVVVDVVSVSVPVLVIDVSSVDDEVSVAVMSVDAVCSWVLV